VYSEADLGEVPIANQPEIFLEMCDFLETEGKMAILTDKFILNIFEEEESIAAPSAYDTEQSYANDVFNEVLHIICPDTLTQIFMLYIAPLVLA